jgi:hypothetical protein
MPTPQSMMTTFADLCSIQQQAGGCNDVLRAACARLGTNAINAEMSLALQRRRVREMESYITARFNQDCHAEQSMSGFMSPELVQRLKMACDDIDDVMG